MGVRCQPPLSKVRKHNMGNKAGKNKATDEDIKYLMSKVEDPSIGGESKFFRLNFNDAGHTKARIQEWQNGEVNDLTKAQFDGFDTDNDQTISIKEFVLLIHFMSDETPEEKIKWAFTTYDTNKDGQIDAEEMKTYVATVTEMMRRQGDGAALAEAVMKKLDTNKDGKISQKEAIAACLANEEIANLFNLSVNKMFHY